MQIARYDIGGAEHYGLLEGDILRRLPGGPFGDLTPTGQTDRVSDATLLSPIKNPRVFAVGMNYIGHIKEAGAKTPDIPVLFMMPTTAVVAMPCSSLVRFWTYQSSAPTSLSSRKLNFTPASLRKELASQVRLASKLVATWLAWPISMAEDLALVT